MRPAPGPARALLLAAVLLAGCTQMQQAQQDRISRLSAEVESLGASLERTEAHLAALQTAVVTEMSTSRASVDQLETSVKGLPDALQGLCSSAASDEARCDETQLQRVVVSDDKMVVGEVETVWLDPPGMHIDAQIDTGASANSLNAEDMVLFERDSDDWVRFHVRNDAGDQVRIERAVLRFVRVYQQADPEGTRRPVVELRVHIGDVEDDFEFTLADRSHLKQQLLLGKSFLTDLALVDVSRQFVQPRFRPKGASQ